MKLIHSFSFFTLLFTFASLTNAQVGIGTTSPDASAKLEVHSTTQGFLPPRISLTATNASTPVSSPVTGLLVYNIANSSSGATAVAPGYYYWGGSGWVRLLVPTDNAANITGTVAVANGGTGVTTSTGAGNVVLSTSPTLITPIISTTSNSSNAGAIRYSTSSGGVLEYSNGTAWNTLTSNVQKATVVAKKTTSQSFNNTTATDVTGWQEVVDVTSNFDPTTGIFTAPRLGNYIVSFSYVFTPDINGANTQAEALLVTSSGTANIKKAVTPFNYTGTSSAGASISFTIRLNASETVRPTIWHSLGSTRSLRIGTGDEDGFVNFSVTEL